jgi:putative ABC transport system substrate-binding protein
MERAMRRREFITLLGGATATWPLVARAQQPATPRIGYVTVQSEGDADGRARNAAFRDALEGLGWAEGRNLRIEYRWGANTPERQRQSASELVGLALDVILAQGSLNSEALRRETGTIPIVFVSASDPLTSGLVDNMAHPGLRCSNR